MEGGVMPPVVREAALNVTTILTKEVNIIKQLQYTQIYNIIHTCTYNTKRIPWQVEMIC
jgi:hypothetical protein